MGKQLWKPGNMLYPLPAVMVSCAREGERPNIITVAWTGTVCTNPPMVYISVRPERYSYGIIRETGEFVINLTTVELAKATDFCGVRSGRDTDKFRDAFDGPAGLLCEGASDRGESGESGMPGGKDRGAGITPYVFGKSPGRSRGRGVSGREGPLGPGTRRPAGVQSRKLSGAGPEGGNLRLFGKESRHTSAGQAYRRSEKIRRANAASLNTCRLSGGGL